MTEEHFQRFYGKRVKMVRVAQGLSQREVAERLGVTYSAYLKLERGTLKNTTTHTTVKLCDIFGCSVTDLVPILKEDETSHLIGEPGMEPPYYVVTNLLQQKLRNIEEIIKQ